jgi:hypothetical protein
MKLLSSAQRCVYLTEFGLVLFVPAQKFYELNQLESLE